MLYELSDDEVWRIARSLRDYAEGLQTDVANARSYGAERDAADFQQSADEHRDLAERLAERAAHKARTPPTITAHEVENLIRRLFYWQVDGPFLTDTEKSIRASSIAAAVCDADETQGLHLAYNLVRSERLTRQQILGSDGLLKATDHPTQE